MSKNEQHTGPDANDTSTNYGKFISIAFQMLAIIGIFTFAGYKIDEAAAHATKWVTAVMSLLGVFISLFIIIRSLKS
jgi:F0F1-type ATP synthase assembly protein I